MIPNLLLLVFGLIFGSFISALSWRIPREKSIAKGRSICPKCKHQIAWYDNIPLLSYLILRGKCRNCNKHISSRYPLIELSSGVGFVLIFILQGSTLQGVYSITSLILKLIIFLILLTIFVIDLEHQIIPDSLIFTGILLVLFYYLFTNHNSLFGNLFSGFFAGSVLMSIHLITNGKGMGLGDVKFAMLGGMIVGLKLLPVWLFTSFLTGGITGIILILAGRAKMKTKIAFGPFLVVGIPVAIIFGDKLLTVFNSI